MLFSQTSSAEPEVAPLALGFLILGGFALVIALIAILDHTFRRRRDPLRYLDRVFVDVRDRARACGLYPNTIEFGGRTYRVTLTGRRVFAWLTTLVDQWRACSGGEEVPNRLVVFRRDFQTIARLRPISGLVGCLRTKDPDLQRIAIWLLGRCKASSALSAVTWFVRDPDPGVRKQVARALRRLDGLADLQLMAHADEDPRIRLLASRLSMTCHRSYDERLKRFVEHAGDEEFEAGEYESHMPLYLLRPIGAVHPSKSREFIRRILEHIHQLVSGSPRNRAA